MKQTTDNRCRAIRATRYHQKGFSLLEAMVGFLILTTGMLGVASLQAISLKAGKTSVYNSVAMMKVQELFESMHANPSSLSTYQGAGVNNNCSGTNTCNSAELAADDVYWWEENLKAGLPPGTTSTSVVVTAPVAPSGLATAVVTVTWQERDKDGSSFVTRSYSATSQICTQIPC